MSFNDIKKLGIAIVLVVLVAFVVELLGNALIQQSNKIVKLVIVFFFEMGNLIPDFCCNFILFILNRLFKSILQVI